MSTIIRARARVLDASKAQLSLFLSIHSANDVPHVTEAAGLVQTSEALKALLAVLRPEGIDWPDRYGGLFEPGRLERAVSDLLAGMERHAELILGSAGA